MPSCCDASLRVAVLSRTRACAYVAVIVRIPNRDARGLCLCRSYICARVRVRVHVRVRAPVREFASLRYAHEMHIRTCHVRTTLMSLKGLRGVGRHRSRFTRCSYNGRIACCKIRRGPRRGCKQKQKMLCFMFFFWTWPNCFFGVSM